MRGQVIEIYKIYEGSSKRLIIPVYQRNYDWKKQHCQQLLDDLTELHKSQRPKHFFGAIVGVADGSFEWIVIDGQQRLTTVSLIMLALAKLLDNGELSSTDPDLAHKIRKNYLVVDDGTAGTKFRLKPVKDDNEAYRRLFTNDDREFINESNITSNYQFFLDQLPALGLGADELWDALCRLEVMHLDLESSDDPQRIFESLNSTGLALSESDKVRNFVLMGLNTTEQIRVYEDYWNRIEKNVGFDTDAFLRWYLISQTATFRRFEDVYDGFKRYAQQQRTKGAKLLEKVRDYSVYARKLRLSSTGDKRIDRRLYRLNLLQLDVIVPFLLPLMEEYENGTLTSEDFAEILRITESYLGRRMVCRIGTQGLNKVFGTLYRDLRKLREEDQALAPILAFNLLERDGSGRFPSDEEFTDAFRTGNMFTLKAERRRYLFDCLENMESKDVRDIATSIKSGDLSIEHIMPQTLSRAWRDELGGEADRIHDVWLHRIANLTITGYNPEYSNTTFSQKKTMEHGFDSSPYRLNRLLKDATHWTEKELEIRNQKLTADALEYWFYPQTDFKPPEQKLPIVPLGSDTVFTHRDIVAFEYDGTKQTVKNWRDFMTKVLSLLVVDHRSEVFDFASTQPKWFPFQIPSPCPGHIFTITKGLNYNASSSTRVKTSILRQLLEHLSLDPEDLLLTLSPEPPRKRTVEEEPDESPYADLLKFIARLEELRGEHPDQDEIKELEKEFIHDFSEFSVENPQSLLGKDIDSFLREDVTKANSRQILAIISAIIVVSRFADPTAFRNRMVNGDLTHCLERLKAASIPKQD